MPTSASEYTRWFKREERPTQPEGPRDGSAPLLVWAEIEDLDGHDELADPEKRLPRR
jgi:hypothetical protein